MMDVGEREEHGLDDEVVSGIIRLLMRIDARLEQLLELLEEDEDEDDES
jgi:hypothetical protein